MFDFSALIVPLAWVAYAILRVRNLLSGEGKHTWGPRGSRSLDSGEFPFPYEIVSIRRLGRDFTCRYLGALIHVKVVRQGKRSVLGLRIDRRFPENVLIRKHYGLLAAVIAVFPIKRWRLSAGRSKRGLILSSKDVSRQLQRIPEFELIAITRDNLVAARYVDGVCSAEMMAQAAATLYNLHVYARKAVEANSYRLEPIDGDLFCPFCRSELRTTEATGCQECGTLHHSSCWHENGGCAVFGCHESIHTLRHQ